MKAKSIVITIVAVLIIVGIIVYISSKPAVVSDNGIQRNSAGVSNSGQNSFESTDDVFQEIDLALQGAE